MPNRNLEDIWTEAQDIEGGLARRVSPREPSHESKEWWEQNLMREFSLDFTFFKGKTVLEVGCGSRGMVSSFWLVTR